MNNSILPNNATIIEVGPRDGLQNYNKIISVETRVEIINKLSTCGFSFIEAGSFVSPKNVPQMQNSDLVFKKIKKNNQCFYPILTPNIIGVEQAIISNASHIAIFGSASESFCQKNINCSIEQSMDNFKAVLIKAKQKNIKVRGYLSCVFGCPYEGIVPLEKTVKLAEDMLNMGCYQISLGDTIGVGTPNMVENLINIAKKTIQLNKLAVHFHDTYGQALVNIYTSLQAGISIIDSSIAGLGGCPFAKGATGNVATEDVIYMLEGLKIKTGIDLTKLIEASHFICDKLGCTNNSKVSLAKK